MKAINTQEAQSLNATESQNKAREVILILRKMLKDENESNFSSGELLDKISMAQNDLIQEFKGNVRHLKLKAKNGAVKLPQKIAFLFQARLNGAQIALKPTLSALKSKEPTLFMLKKELRLANSPLNDFELEILAAFFTEPLQSEESALVFDFEYNTALALGALNYCFLSDFGGDFLQKREYFKKVYNEEIQRLRSYEQKASGRSFYLTKTQI